MAVLLADRSVAWWVVETVMMWVGMWAAELVVVRVGRWVGQTADV